MKQLLFIILSLGLAFSIQAQSCCSSTPTKDTSCCASDTGKKKSKLTKRTKHVSFKVYGNCGMCEEKIEAAAENLKGVALADWNPKTGTMRVSYKSKKTNLDQIKQAIADAGYDSDTHRADDEVYDNLHVCCKYDRPQS